MEKLRLNQQLGEIVSIFPGSSEIFNRYKIDYCCGGHDSLQAALDVAKLDSEAIIEELNVAYEEFVNSDPDYKDWRKEKPSVLIKHIMDTHHNYTKKELKEIDGLVFKILKVHYSHHAEELLQVHKLFGNLKIELEEHLVKEEENLFPLMEAYEKTGNEKFLSAINEFIEETESEHDAAGDILKELERITRDFKVPEGACTTFKLAYDKIHALQKDLFTHIYLENSVLFSFFTKE